jgi:hypothetical protein
VNGSVLITGGAGGDEESETLASAELYDPALSSFSRAGNLNVARGDHTATLLNDGRVLITGGLNTQGLASAELFTPSGAANQPPLLIVPVTATSSQAKVYHAGTTMIASHGAPAVFGETLQIPVSGLMDGSVIAPQVAIGGQVAEVQSFGPVSGQTGMGQVTVVVPSGATPNSNAPVNLSYLGRTSQATIAVAPDPWQEAATEIVALAGSDSMNFFQWSAFWQSAPVFPYSAAGFGVQGSINSDLSSKILAASGGDGSQTKSVSQWINIYRAVVPDPWQQSTAALIALAGTNRLNFFEWAWYWQRATVFPNAPPGFGVMGSIDNTPGLNPEIIALGGGDGSQMVSADQWVNDYRAFIPDPWQQASSAMATAAGTNSQNYWQWAWYWQRAAVFPNAPFGFGVPGSIDDVPDLIQRIVALGGGDGSQIISADQWVNWYRVAAPDAWQQATAGLMAIAGTDRLSPWQWTWYWQRAQGFPYAPPGFGVLGSIDTIPGLVGKIVVASGVDGNQTISAKQWVDAYRQVWSTPQP